ncbi:hypothetical protein NE237_000921 [Protea cynaroides]|uniref:Uncharacterized protein n=1 Tax=Protea cynaroides TaxID=273540 RepID=A0A9Q0KSC9_9MAGN|nr:hypothetical protein NE237_000921 [Protea cynaroides]
MKDHGKTRKKRGEEKSDTPRNQTSSSREPSPRDLGSDGEEDEEEILYETPKSTKKPQPRIDKRMDNVEHLLREDPEYANAEICVNTPPTIHKTGHETKVAHNTEGEGRQQHCCHHEARKSNTTTAAVRRAEAGRRRKEAAGN